MRRVMQALSGLRITWRLHAGVLPSSLLGCFLTCMASVAANMLCEGWSAAGGAAGFPRRLAIGYAAAAATVVLVFPLLRGLRARQRRTMAHASRHSKYSTSSPPERH